MLLGLSRYPHALVVCASAAESALKAVLSSPSESRDKWDRLIKDAQKLYPELRRFSWIDLRNFWYARNRIAHFGFSPRDDDEAAMLLLKTGFPFLMDCYRRFFDFDLELGLDPRIARQLTIATEAFSQVPEPRYSYCLRVLGYLIQWIDKHSRLTDWEVRLGLADEVGAKGDVIRETKRELERLFGCPWAFDCPVCSEPEAFICELDEDQLGAGRVHLQRAMCVNCELKLSGSLTFLTDALCQGQVAEQRVRILNEYGISPDS